MKCVRPSLLASMYPAAFSESMSTTSEFSLQDLSRPCSCCSAVDSCQDVQLAPHCARLLENQDCIHNVPLPAVTTIAPTLTDIEDIPSSKRVIEQTRITLPSIIVETNLPNVTVKAAGQQEADTSAASNQSPSSASKSTLEPSVPAVSVSLSGYRINDSYVLLTPNVLNLVFVLKLCVALIIGY